MSGRYEDDELALAELRIFTMTPGTFVVTTQRYAEQFPADGLPWRGIVKRITKSGLVNVKWLTSMRCRESTLHPVFLELEPKSDQE